MIVVASNTPSPAAQVAAAVGVPDSALAPASVYRLPPGVVETHVIIDAQPSPVFDDTTQTDEPAPQPTAIVLTPDPNDPGTNPSAPGGILTTVVAVLAGIVIGGLTMLMSLLTFIGKFKNDPITQTTIERLIAQLGNSVPAFAPIPALLNKTGQAMEDAGDVIKKVSDGQPNL